MVHRFSQSVRFSGLGFSFQRSSSHSQPWGEKITRGHLRSPEQRLLAAGSASYTVTHSCPHCPHQPGEALLNPTSDHRAGRTDARESSLLFIISASFLSHTFSLILSSFVKDAQARLVIQSSEKSNLCWSTIIFKISQLPVD